MKKKVLSAMLVATMTATMFAGCGSDKGTTNDTQVRLLQSMKANRQ